MNVGQIFSNHIVLNWQRSIEVQNFTQYFVDMLSRLKTGCGIAWRSQNEAVHIHALSIGTRSVYALRAALSAVRASIMKEYRWPNLKPSCDVIDGINTIKNTFSCIIWDDLFICAVNLELCLIFQRFQTGRHFEVATNYFAESDNGS